MRIQYPTDRPNFVIVTNGAWCGAFSYETLIAFRDLKWNWVIRENEWGSTTGKHMNHLDPDKKIRVGSTEFEIAYIAHQLALAKRMLGAGPKLFDNR